MEVEQGIRLLQQRYKSVMLRIPVIIGNTAVNFTLDNFRRQGFLGNTFERWQNRKQGWKNDKRKGRPILIGTGRLRRSVRIVRISQDGVLIGTDVPYAKAHNEGLKIGEIQTVKGFTRRNGSEVKAHTRRINQNIPRRRYMGNSPYLNALLKRNVSAEFIKELKTS